MFYGLCGPLAPSIRRMISASTDGKFKSQDSVELWIRVIDTETTWPTDQDRQGRNLRLGYSVPLRPRGCQIGLAYLGFPTLGFLPNSPTGLTCVCVRRTHGLLAQIRRCKQNEEDKVYQACSRRHLNQLLYMYRLMYYDNNKNL